MVQGVRRRQHVAGRVVTRRDRPLLRRAVGVGLRRAPVQRVVGEVGRRGVRVRLVRRLARRLGTQVPRVVVGQRRGRRHGRAVSHDLLHHPVQRVVGVGRRGRMRVVRVGRLPRRLRQQVAGVVVDHRRRGRHGRAVAGRLRYQPIQSVIGVFGHVAVGVGGRQHVAGEVVGRRRGPRLRRAVAVGLRSHPAQPVIDVLRRRGMRIRLVRRLPRRLRSQLARGVVHHRRGDGRGRAVGVDLLRPVAGRVVGVRRHVTVGIGHRDQVAGRVIDVAGRPLLRRAVGVGLLHQPAHAVVGIQRRYRMGIGVISRLPRCLGNQVARAVVGHGRGHGRRRAVGVGLRDHPTRRVVDVVGDVAVGVDDRLHLAVVDAARLVVDVARRLIQGVGFGQQQPRRRIVGPRRAVAVGVYLHGRFGEGHVVLVQGLRSHQVKDLRQIAAARWAVVVGAVGRAAQRDVGQDVRCRAKEPTNFSFVFSLER